MPVGLVIDRVDHFIITICFIAVKILGLTTMTRIYERSALSVLVRSFEEEQTVTYNGRKVHRLVEHHVQAIALLGSATTDKSDSGYEHRDRQQTIFCLVGICRGFLASSVRDTISSVL